MVKRIVQMTFQPERVGEFLALFEQHRSAIRNAEGCRHLELWQNRDEPNVFFTYSWWDSEADLDRYRNSSLFGHVWPRTKELFLDAPQAWTVQEVRIPEGRQEEGAHG